MSAGRANYHTHTARCGHATGTDEEYVLAAIDGGFGELGFSDHVPWPYKSGFTNPRVRMHVSRMGEYIASVRALKEKYAGRVNILAGFECEYFPEYMGWLAETAERERLDYLILGNHYGQSDETGLYFGATRTPEMLRAYVDWTTRGVRSGLFSYLAHPDLFMRRYGKFDADCRAAARDLCQACRQENLPMEYNLHMLHVFGDRERAGYPCEAFFDIALTEGVDVLVGMDAHSPEELADSEGFEAARRVLSRFGDRLLSRMTPRGFGAAR